MKKFLALILALVMSLALVACGGGSDDAATDDGAAESGKTTVTKGSSAISRT